MLSVMEMSLNSKFNNFEFNDPELVKDDLSKFNNFEFIMKRQFSLSKNCLFIFIKAFFCYNTRVK